MATDLTALDLAIALSLAGSTQKGLDLSTPQDTLNLSKSLALAFGTGAGKADQVFHDRRILAGSGSEDLDLAGVLTNAYGGAVTFAKVKAIIVLNRSDETLTTPVAHTATDAEVAVGGAAANEFQGPFQAAGDAIGIPAGGIFVIACNDANGWAVTAGTGDLLKIENLDAVDEACFDIVVIGESA